MALVTIPNAPEGVNDPSALWRLSVTVDQRDMRFKVRVSPSLALAFGLCPALVQISPPRVSLTPLRPHPTGSMRRRHPDRRGTHAQGDRTHPPSAAQRLGDGRAAHRRRRLPTLPRGSRLRRARESRRRRARVDASSTSVPRYTTAPPGKQKKRAAGTLVSPPYVRDEARYEYVTPSSADILSGAAPRVVKFACPVCDKGFAQCQQLVFHVKSHKREAMSRAHQQAMDAAVRSMHNTTAQATDSPATKERRFFCPSPACEHNPEVDPARSFKDFANCRQHYLRRHTNEKPFKCPKCDRAYAVKPDMQTHAKQCGMVPGAGARGSTSRDLRAHGSVGRGPRGETGGV